MKKNKFITWIYYVSLLVLLGVVLLSFILTITDHYVAANTFVGDFIRNVFSLSGYVGVYFAPFAILLSIISMFFDRSKIKYFIIILIINIIFIISSFVLAQMVFNSITMMP